jgi:hypothetical protein
MKKYLDEKIQGDLSVKKDFKNKKKKKLIKY